MGIHTNQNKDRIVGNHIMLFVFTHCLAHILPTLPHIERPSVSVRQAALRTRPLAEPAVTQNADAWLPSWRCRLHVFELGSKAFKKYQCRSFQSSFFAFCITLHACSFLEMAVDFYPQKAGSIRTTGVFKEMDQAFGEAS